MDFVRFSNPSEQHSAEEVSVTNISAIIEMRSTQCLCLGSHKKSMCESMEFIVRCKDPKIGSQDQL